MAHLHAGRFTDNHEGGVVVFLIGMRVNRWRSFRHWWPVFSAMPRMLRELATNPSRGFLGHRMMVGAGGPVLVQYWRTADDLMAYAHDTAAEHRPAWRAFNARSRSSRGAVGIWHETFVVPAGAHESVYVNMPATGLAAASSAVPVGAVAR